ncbi:Lung seven transmembrane receptor [Fragilaria crotonensis]|nr:Lung seven transmembrane receptor [Fragilaria crotonensis]
MFLSISDVLNRLLLLLVLQYYYAEYNHDSNVFVSADRRVYSGFLEPMPFLVHFASGYVEPPGLVDLKSLEFSTPYSSWWTGAANASVVDVVLFYEPQDCINTAPTQSRPGGCDWTKLGIGGNGNGELLFCCTEDHFEMGLCDGPVDRLIVDRNTFQGQMRSLDIPGPPDLVSKQILKNPVFDIPATSGSGKYILIMANCNVNGRLVEVEGSYAFRSKAGYLPANLIGTMRFYFLMLVAYSLLIVAAWWGLGYSFRPRTITPPCRQGRRQLFVERGIILTIGLGWMESVVRSLDFYLWNIRGTQANALVYLTILPDVSKHALTRTLLVMLGVGWGVVASPASVSAVSMKQHYIRMVVLGGSYFILSTVVKILNLELIATLENFSHFDDTSIRSEAIDLLADFAIFGTELLFQSKFGAISSLPHLVAVVVGVAAVYLIMVKIEVLDHNKDDTVLSWIASNLMELDYFVMIAGVTYLWRPGDSEILPLLEGEEDENDDDEEGRNEVELRGEEMEVTRSFTASSAAYTPVEQHDLELSESLPVKSGVAT